MMRRTASIYSRHCRPRRESHSISRLWSARDSEISGCAVWCRGTPGHFQRDDFYSEHSDRSPGCDDNMGSRSVCHAGETDLQRGRYEFRSFPGYCCVACVSTISVESNQLERNGKCLCFHVSPPGGEPDRSECFVYERCADQLSVHVEEWNALRHAPRRTLSLC